MADYILAIDQGTTSTRAILFDQRLEAVTSAQREFTQYLPRSGWVEHDPEDIWQTTLDTCHEVLQSDVAQGANILGIGLTNQRETTLVWNRKTGKPVHNAIVWQDRRTADVCRRLTEQGHEETVTAKTGLLLDPYFSSTKLAWILDNVDGARAQAEAGELLFGTVDTYLIWRLTGGKSFVTDATNACRTMLYDIHKGRWSLSMQDMLNIPGGMFPEVLDSSADFGTTSPDVLGHALPILGAAGDQQAATVGQACFRPGMAKATYGTGCFALLNTGDQAVRSSNRLLTTIAYQLDGKPTYALEGSIFIAGAVVQWLRDGPKLIVEASETQGLAESADPAQDLIFVPALTGLGAPYWDADARGAIFGLTRGTGAAEITRAALESVGFQTRDLLEAMHADREGSDDDSSVLRVDGGMSASDYAMQFLADIIGAPVDRPKVLETTAQGAAWLAGQRVGFYQGMQDFTEQRVLDRTFEPKMPGSERNARYETWKQAVAATRSVRVKA